MRKIFAVFALAAFMALGTLGYALAQTQTPTVTPSVTAAPTSVPDGAPSTGHGSLR